MLWSDVTGDGKYLRPAPTPATPGTLRLQFGRYRILQDFGPCYCITNDQGTVLAAEYCMSNCAQWRLTKRGRRALKRLQELPAGTFEEVVIDPRRNLEHRERELGIGA